MAKGVTLSIRFTNMDKLATIEAVLNGMGIQYLKQEYEFEEAKKAEEKPVEEPKKAEKKTTGKKSSDKKGKDVAKKGSEDFDYELYKSIAEQLGVYGKHGCYRFARPTVKSLMQHPEYLTKAGKLQAKVKKSALATLLTVAQTDGLQWYIDSVASGKVAKVQ